MKPYAQKVDRIQCPRCKSANLNVIVKGSINKDGAILLAIREVEECPICHYVERKQLSAEDVEKVKTKINTENMKTKNMYEVKASREAGDYEWCLIEWKGSWRDKDAMSELGRALAEACRSVKLVGDDEVIDSGYHLDSSRDGKRRLFIRKDMIPKFEEIIEIPIFQDAFTPWARISDDTAQAINDAFSDIE